MKAICVKNTLEKTSNSKFNYLEHTNLKKLDLTIGEIYDIEEMDNIPNKYKVIDDFRKVVHTPLDFFKRIDQIRDETIKKILK